MKRLNPSELLDKFKPGGVISQEDMETVMCFHCKLVCAIPGKQFCEHCEKYFSIERNVPAGYRNMTIDNFKYLTPEHEIALGKAMCFVNETMPGIYLYGDVGVGKTHLMTATLIRALQLGKYSRYFNVSEMLHIKREEYETQEDAEMRLLDKLLLPKFLFLDDLLAEKASEKTRAFLYLLFNKILEVGKPKLFITSNAPLSMISASMDDRIASRIAGVVGKNGVLKLTGKDQRIK